MIDYLLKPISFDRFLKAVDKLYDNIPSSTTVEVAAAHPSPRYVFVTSEKKNIKICLDEIEYVESKRDYILIKTSNKEVLTHQTITYMDEHLPDGCFLRVHRSFIINLKKLDSWNSHEVEISGETARSGAPTNEKLSMCCLPILKCFNFHIHPKIKLFFLYIPSLAKAIAPNV